MLWHGVLHFDAGKYPTALNIYSKNVTVHHIKIYNLKEAKGRILSLDSAPEIVVLLLTNSSFFPLLFDYHTIWRLLHLR